MWSCWFLFLTLRNHSLFFILQPHHPCMCFFFLLCLIKQTTIAYNIHCHNSTQQWLSVRKKGSRRGRASWVFGMVFFIYYYYIVYLHFSRLRVWPGITTAAVALNNDKEALSQAPCMYVLFSSSFFSYNINVYLLTVKQATRTTTTTIIVVPDSEEKELETQTRVLEPLVWVFLLLY